MNYLDEAEKMARLFDDEEDLLYIQSLRDEESIDYDEAEDYEKGKRFYWNYNKL